MSLLHQSEERLVGGAKVVLKKICIMLSYVLGCFAVNRGVGEGLHYLTVK